MRVFIDLYRRLNLIPGQVRDFLSIVCVLIEKTAGKMLRTVFHPTTTIGP